MKIIKNQKIILVSNIGSASRKYFVFSVVKNTKKVEELFSVQFDEKEYYPKVKLEDAILEFFEIAKNRYGFRVSDIDVIAERVVAAGEYFLENRIIDEKYIDKLEDATKYDSLHTRSLINEIQKIFLIKDVCEKNKIKCKFKLVGISDSAFHSTISSETFTYGIRTNNKNNYRKYGYHGISMSEVVNELQNKYKKIIGIHLGGGGSVTAIEGGKSIYNSFGMTPASGLVNLTRAGDIDPFVVLSILENKKKSFRFLSEDNYLYKEVERELYENSGLYALTGERDMRDILINLEVKDKKTRDRNSFALDVYINRINEYLGSALSHLGEVDALVLTGSILEKSEIFRKRLFKKISWLNIKENNILIMKTEEEKEMARLVVQEKFV